MDYKMTDLQAFKSMVCFLDDYYYTTTSDNLAVLLGGMQLLENDEGTWDPAMWYDWISAIENQRLVTPTQGFKGMFNFLKTYYERTNSAFKDIKAILDDMQMGADEKPIKAEIWNKWIYCVEKNL